MRITTDAEASQALRVTASFGIASYPESKARDGEDLVRRADRALFRAKKTGKNRVELYWSDDSGPARPVTEPGDDLPPAKPRAAERDDPSLAKAQAAERDDPPPAK